MKGFSSSEDSLGASVVVGGSWVGISESGMRCLLRLYSSIRYDLYSLRKYSFMNFQTPLLYSEIMLSKKKPRSRTPNMLSNCLWFSWSSGFTREKSQLKQVNGTEFFGNKFLNDFEDAFHLRPRDRQEHHQRVDNNKESQCLLAWKRGKFKDSIQYFISNEFYRSMISDNFRIRNSLPRRQTRLPTSSSYPSQPLLFPLFVFAPFSVSSSPRKRQTNDKVNRQEWEKQRYRRTGICN